eukprot:CAMPEP_0183720284 /NCGR_PEP_ID=MMETSP0737-20130205/12944_1 /TAXON_ID=385413 /ORGANISM="Thalassiosira miniscula, Strain CCMP1093" /LENGTH=1194 /DNA_ID=CAMNT_0025950129 /DNA_START=262 /DNA_END=3846 /DNA_ORIENTATION=+
MTGNHSPPSISNIGPLLPPNRRQRLALSCLLLVALPVLASSFRKSYTLQPLAFQHNHHQAYETRRWARLKNRAKQTPPLPILKSSLDSMESGINSSIEELESLHRMRHGPPLSSTDPKEDEANQILNASPALDFEEKQQPQHEPRGQQSLIHTPKPTITSILRTPEGELTASNLNSLCNSIRHPRKGMSFENLKILERILIELDHQYQAEKGTSTASLKPIHVFSTLAACSKDLQTWKQREGRGSKRRKRTHHNHHRRERIGEQEIQRLVRTVTLLNQQRQRNNPGCYTKDVPSFATMIAAEASRWETASSAAVDAALFFLDMVEKEEQGGGGNSNEWDPRLIGAVLDALARVGRAEDAQALLERALGVSIPILVGEFGSANEDSSGEGSVPAALPAMRLDPLRSGPCYDALLRAWSNKATRFSRADRKDKSLKKHEKVKKNIMLAKSSMAQARHILLNHMPLQPDVAITNRTCTSVLGGYSSLGMGLESEKLLLELEALHLSPLYSASSLKESSSKLARTSSLDVGCYNAVLHAYSQSQDSDDVASAERLFTCMKEQTPLKISVKNSKINNVNEEDASSSTTIFSVIPPKPDLISFSSMLNCYSRHGSVSKAEKLLDEMHESFVPNVACYLPIISALDKSGDADAPDRVLQWIERSHLSLPRPNRQLFITALRCMRRYGRGEEAEIILDKFQKAYPDRGAPDIFAYILVLRAWEQIKRKVDRHHAAKRARIFLDKMETMSEESFLPTLDISAYNIMLNCYARAGEAEEAEKLLADLEGGSLSPYGDTIAAVEPDSKSYSTVIKAWANNGGNDSVDRAWQILYRLGYPKKTNPKQQQVPFNVSMNNFNSMLMLFAKRGMASEAEALLNRIDELVVEGTIKKGGPDIQSYEAVLEALGRCKDTNAPTRAEALVTRLEVMSEMGGDFQPSLLAYNTLLNCYANAGMAGKAERLLERLNDPDSFSVGSTIKAIANSGKSQLVSMSSADSLAKTVGTGNEIIFAHRLKLCSKWGLGKEAELLLEQMKERHLNPGVIHYTAVLNAWAKSSDNNATARAEALFMTMEDSSFELDLAAYHGLLLNYSSRGKSKKARRLLQRILDSPDMVPNRNSFTMVIDSYARSGSQHAAEKAEELLDQMRELHAAGNRDVEPDSVTYASVIRCKKRSKDAKKIHTMSTFEKIKMMQELQIEAWPFEADK